MVAGGEMRGGDAAWGSLAWPTRCPIACVAEEDARWAGGSKAAAQRGARGNRTAFWAPAARVSYLDNRWRARKATEPLFTQPATSAAKKGPYKHKRWFVVGWRAARGRAGLLVGGGGRANQQGAAGGVPWPRAGESSCTDAGRAGRPGWWCLGASMQRGDTSARAQPATLRSACEASI